MVQAAFELTMGTAGADMGTAMEATPVDDADDGGAPGPGRSDGESARPSRSRSRSARLGGLGDMSQIDSLLSLVTVVIAMVQSMSAEAAAVLARLQTLLRQPHADDSAADPSVPAAVAKLQHIQAEMEQLCAHYVMLEDYFMCMNVKAALRDALPADVVDDVLLSLCVRPPALPSGSASADRHPRAELGLRTPYTLPTRRTPSLAASGVDLHWVRWVRSLCSCT